MTHLLCAKLHFFSFSQKSIPKNNKKAVISFPLYYDEFYDKKNSHSDIVVCG